MIINKLTQVMHKQFWSRKNTDLRGTTGVGVGDGVTGRDVNDDIVSPAFMMTCNKFTFKSLL